MADGLRLSIALVVATCSLPSCVLAAEPCGRFPGSGFDASDMACAAVKPAAP